MGEVSDHSIILSRTLDALELSDDHVRSRVSKFSRLEVLANAVDFQPDYQNTILTGSIMDGVGWKGYMTDIDTMLRFSYVTVKEKGHSQSNHDGHHIFEIEAENVHPGYTRLRLYKEGRLMDNNIFSLTPKGARSYCYEEEGNRYLSSYKFKSAFNRYQVIPERPAWVMQSSYNYAVTFPDDEEILEHGPSLCFSDDTKEESMHDAVPCFHCQQWPIQASGWKMRSPRNWPPKTDVDRIVSAGCEVVPVGFIGSQSRHLEWRLSFALAERQLLCTFNNTQHKCYSLLKMLLKDVVMDTVPNVLSSFQMKNALFWTLEKTDIAIWCEERITEAFMECVKTMHYFLQNGKAPGYFIAENNVLDRRMNETEQNQLVELFDGFIKEGWKCLLQCQSLTTEPNLRTLLELYEEASCLDRVLQEIVKTDVKSIWSQHDLTLFPRYEDARLEIMTYVAPKPECLSMTIARHHMMLQQLEDRSVSDFYRNVLKPIVASIKSSLGSHLFSFYIENNKVSAMTTGLQEILPLAEENLINGMESDASAGRLKYATYLYMTGKMEKCKEIAESILQNGNRLSAYVPHFLPSKFGPTAQEVQDYEKFVRDNEMDLEQRYLSSVCQAVLFLPTEREASPPAVQFQMQTSLPEPLAYTSWLGWAIYDPVVYAYYLLFLCEMKVGRVSDAENFLVSIEKLLAEENVGYEVSALNLLGYSYVFVNNVEKGVPFLLKAMEISVAPNSTVWQLGRSLSDILNGPHARQKNPVTATL